METNMYLTGFADEAARDIDGQIKATLELGWKNIETRCVNGTNIHDISDADFDIVYGKLADAGVSVNCFGSGIANWAKDIRNPFDEDFEAAKRALARMKRLGTKMIRIMSYPPIKDRPMEDQMKEERFSRIRQLVDLFGSAGIDTLHENCMNYGGQGWKYTLELLENVPGLKLVFDTGNPVNTLDRERPGQRQSAWEFYEHVRDHIVYVHIKDGVVENGQTKWCYCGEGDGDVEKIVRDLLARGYDGGFSMEPHMAAIAHEGTTSPEELMYANYIEYGRRFEKILEKCRK